MNSGKILAADLDGVPILKFVGDVRVVLSSTLDRYISSMLAAPALGAIVVDLSETTGIDSTALGLIAKMAIEAKKRFHIKPTIISPNPDITRILTGMNMGVISTILHEPLSRNSQFKELEYIEDSEDSVRTHVVAAHEALMSICDSNQLKFQYLMEELGKE